MEDREKLMAEAQNNAVSGVAESVTDAGLSIGSAIEGLTHIELSGVVLGAPDMLSVDVTGVGLGDIAEALCSVARAIDSLADVVAVNSGPNKPGD